LTGSEDESSSGHADLPTHGLLLEGTFRTPGTRLPQAPAYLTPMPPQLSLTQLCHNKLSEGRHSLPGHNNVLHDHPARSKSFAKYTTKYAKRRRLDHDTLGPERQGKESTERPGVKVYPQIERTSNHHLTISTQPAGVVSTSNDTVANKKTLKRPSITITRPGIDKAREDAISESLKTALREQIFPHINQRLEFYRRSIDGPTRRQLAKRVSFRSQVYQVPT
jgi:hypothetical protein